MRKICFSEHFGLHNAVLERRKNQTRRLIAKITNEQIKRFQAEYYNATFDFLSGKELLEQYFLIERAGKLPYEIGETVAIAERYSNIMPDDEQLRKTAGWRNKMFVKPELMPHHIQMTKIRFEQLQDISDEDCIAEGIYKDDGKTYFNGYAFQITRDQYGNMLSKQWFPTPREAYAALIDKISGKGTWESNPYVFAYTFELAK